MNIWAKHIPRLATNAQLNIALKALMPDTLKTGWSAFLSEHTLTLKVPHNALAMKIKQIAPILIDGLKITGWNVHYMEVKVSHFNHPVWLINKKEHTSDFTARVLSLTSSQYIQTAIIHLPEDSPMRHALMRILSEHTEQK